MPLFRRRIDAEAGFIEVEEQGSKHSPEVLGQLLREGRRSLSVCVLGAGVILLVSTLSVDSVFAASARLQPVDEASKDPSFLAFRKRLVRAVRKHDLKFVISILDPEIKNSFGGEGGIDEFKSVWRPDKADSKLWGNLLRILSMGGSFSTRNPDWDFSVPYVFSRWPDDYDPFEYAAITGADVNLRREAGMSAPILKQLNYDIVKLEEDNPGDANRPWTRVRTLDGIVGYVSSRFVYSPIDYRAGFSRHDGKWRMQFFLAGD